MLKKILEFLTLRGSGTDAETVVVSNTRMTRMIPVRSATGPTIASTPGLHGDFQRHTFGTGGCWCR